jgi:hypothetical protein
LKIKAQYSIVDFWFGGILSGMITDLTFPLRKAFKVSFKPRWNFPDLIIEANTLLIPMNNR